MFKYRNRKQQQLQKLTKLEKLKAKGFRLTAHLIPDLEGIKHLYDKYMEATMFDDIDPVRPIRRTQDQVSLDFSEYNKKLQRFEIKELLKIGPYMITLNIGKIAHVFNRFDHKLVGVLNSDILWDIKTLMYNATRKSVIVIYVKREPTRRKSIQ